MKRGREKGDGTTQDEVLVPFPQPRAQIPAVSKVRSTLIVSSFAAIRQRGKEKEYLVKLPKQHHETILSTIAGMWLPIDVALAHYEALEALALTTGEQVLSSRRART